MKEQTSENVTLDSMLARIQAHFEGKDATGELDLSFARHRGANAARPPAGAAPVLLSLAQYYLVCHARPTAETLRTMPEDLFIIC